MRICARLRIQCAVTALLLFCTIRAEQPDSISPIQASDTIPAYMIPGGVYVPSSGNVQWPVTLDVPYINPTQQNAWSSELPSLKFNQLVPASIFSWSSGGLYGSGGSQSMPGMMGIDIARLNLRQNYGNLTFTLWGGATKYGYYRGLQTSWGLGGAIDYRISDNWSVTLFGEYHTPLNAITPGMGGYMSIPRFGGYFTYDIDDHWGISLGAQTQRSIFTNSWEVQPIVMPYYRINKDVKLGIDVGGIMYHVLRDWLNGRQGGFRGSPIIAPPVQGPPPIAPRK